MARGVVLAVAMAFTALAPVAAKTPAFDPREWKNAHAGPPTQVLTLGSAHLSQMPAPVTPDLLEPLLAKLAAFKPDIITQEGISGEQCDLLRRFRQRYPDMWSTYCRGTEEAEMATGLSVAEAMAAIETTLAAWPATPQPAQRRKLAATFLAAGDFPSALVQWLQLPAEEQKEGDGIDASLVRQLKRENARRNETYDIAAVLAARLGHQRVYAVDDHTADSIQALAGPGLEAAILPLWQAPKTGRTKEYGERVMNATTPAAMLDFYRFLNAAETQRAFIASDMGAALKLESPALYGRQYVAWYETRNLRMVANIRAAFGNRPGARVLNIVGASHKAYYDAYLDMMHEVKLVDADEVLK